MQVSIFRIDVTFQDCEEDPSICWGLKFNRTCENGANFSFIVDEPYLHSKEVWLEMCHGKPNLYDFYQGNGEGSIRIGKGKIEFKAYLSGAGGDVEMIFTEEFDQDLQGNLLKAITEAIEQGLLK